MTLQVKKMPGPTPPRAQEAINTIAEYMREYGWREAVITDKGAASFHLQSYWVYAQDAAVEDER